MRDLSLVCDLYHGSGQCLILNPLSKARDWTPILVDTSWIHFCCSIMGTSSLQFFKVLITTFLKKRSSALISMLLFLAFLPLWLILFPFCLLFHLLAFEFLKILYFLFLESTYSFSFFFLPLSWHMEIPGQGIKPMPQQWPKLVQWQHWILTLLCHKGTPGSTYSWINLSTTCLQLFIWQWHILMCISLSQITLLNYKPTYKMVSSKTKTMIFKIANNCWVDSTSLFQT